MKSNHMPTKRLRIKLSKKCFFNILKYVRKRACLIVMDIPVPNQPTTFKFPQRSFGKTNPVKRSFQASWFTNRTWLHYDEAYDLVCYQKCLVAYRKVILTVLTFEDKTYRGVEIAAHTLVVGFETSLNTASCNVCTINRVSQAKMASESLLQTP